MGKIQNIDDFRNNDEDVITFTDLRDMLDWKANEYNMKKELLGAMTRMALDYLKDSGRSIGKLHVIQDDFTDTDIAPGERLHLVMASDNGYQVFFHLFFMEEEYDLSVALCHEIENGEEWFDRQTGKWIVKHKTWLDRILEEEGTAENEIAVCMLNYGFLPFSNSENESEAVLKDQIRKYKPLLELWKKMDGMVTIDLIPNRETTFEVVLVPADSFVSGFVVGYNERFKVVQYLDHGEYMELWEEAYPNARCTVTKELSMTVAVEKDMDQIASLLKACLDHYFRDPVVILPLSTKAYITSKDPFRSMNVHAFRDDLTGEEKKHMLNDAYYFGTDKQRPMIIYDEKKEKGESKNGKEE